MDTRFELFETVISAFDEGFDLAAKYDTMPHQYGDWQDAECNDY